jgi:hypothetical protein
MTAWRSAGELKKLSIEGQMPAACQTTWATGLVRRMLQSWYRLGIEATNTWLAGRPVRRMSRVSVNWVRKVAVEVRVPSQPQRSLAPMRMVTYSAPWPTVLRAWPGASAIWAPETALFQRWPRMAGFWARRRS